MVFLDKAIRRVAWNLERVSLGLLPAPRTGEVYPGVTWPRAPIEGVLRHLSGARHPLPGEEIVRS